MPVLFRCMELGGTVGERYSTSKGLCPVSVIVPTFLVVLFFFVPDGLPSALWLWCFPVRGVLTTPWK